MNKSDNIALVMNLLLDEKTAEVLNKKLIPVPAYRIGTKLFNLPDSVEEFKKIVSLSVLKHKDDLDELEKILIMHDISQNSLYVTFALHFYYKNDLYNYKDKLAFNMLFKYNELEKIYEDLKRFIQIYTKEFNVKFLSINDILKEFSEIKDFIEIIEEKKD